MDETASLTSPIPPTVQTPATAGSSNTSGQGSSAVVPEEVKGWSWGAALLTFIWGVGNRVWISLAVFLAIIPFIGWIFGLAMSIVLGLKGREWAWQSKHWDSVEHFNKVQKQWAFWGVVISIVIPGIIFLLIIVLIAVNPAWRIDQAQQQLEENSILHTN